MQLSKKIPDAIKLLIIDMRHVPYIDQSGLYSLESIILSLEQNKVQVYLLNLQKQPHAMMKNILLIPNVVESNSLFDDEFLCAEAAKRYIEQTLKIN
jgi:SulP family sulfate permease